MEKGVLPFSHQTFFKQNLLQLYHLHCITALSVVIRCILRPECASKSVCGRSSDGRAYSGRGGRREGREGRLIILCAIIGIGFCCQSQTDEVWVLLFQHVGYGCVLWHLSNAQMILGDNPLETTPPETTPYQKYPRRYPSSPDSGSWP